MTRVLQLILIIVLVGVLVADPVNRGFYQRADAITSQGKPPSDISLSIVHLFNSNR
jgi:hypothetical protein